MKIMLTGTRSGMTGLQKLQFRSLLTKSRPERFLHGDCIGADAQGHLIVDACCPETVIEIYPSTHSARAFCAAEAAVPPMSPLQRNKLMVQRADYVIACPKGPETLRSGTWATVRHARRTRKPGNILWPDGMVTGLEATVSPLTKAQPEPVS